MRMSSGMRRTGGAEYSNVNKWMKKGEEKREIDRGTDRWRERLTEGETGDKQQRWSVLAGLKVVANEPSKEWYMIRMEEMRANHVHSWSHGWIRWMELVDGFSESIGWWDGWTPLRIIHHLPVRLSRHFVGCAAEYDVKCSNYCDHFKKDGSS